MILVYGPCVSDRVADRGPRGRVAYQTRHPRRPAFTFNPHGAHTGFAWVKNAGALPLYPTRVPPLQSAVILEELPAENHSYQTHRIQRWVVRETTIRPCMRRAIQSYYPPQSQAQTRPLEVKVSRRPYSKPHTRRLKKPRKISRGVLCRAYNWQSLRWDPTRRPW